MRFRYRRARKEQIERNEEVAREIGLLPKRRATVSGGKSAVGERPAPPRAVVPGRPIPRYDPPKPPPVPVGPVDTTDGMSLIVNGYRIQVGPAHPDMARLDRVVWIPRDGPAYMSDGFFALVPGVPSPSPRPPALHADVTSIAVVYVPPGAVKIAPANITYLAWNDDSPLIEWLEAQHALVRRKSSKVWIGSL